MKLDTGPRQILRLVSQGADQEGWAKVSKVVWPLLDTVPTELIEKRPAEEGGHVRLTAAGATVLKYL